jgi:ABC-type antimicrobial peptide transport system permease subunit
MASTTYSDISQKVFKKTISKIPDEIQIERNLELEKAGILIDYKQYYAAILFSLVLGCISSLLVTFFIYLLFPSMYTLLLFLLLPALVVGCIGLFFLYYPGYRIKRRAYNIDRSRVFPHQRYSLP